MTTKTIASSRDVSSEICYLTRALKAPTLRESAARLADRARAEIEVRLFTADGLQAATHLLEEVACLPMVTGRPARVEPVVPADGADGRGPAPP